MSVEQQGKQPTLAEKQQERRRARTLEQLGLASEWLALPGVAQEAQDLWRVFIETHPKLITEVGEGDAKVKQSPTLTEGLADMDRTIRFGGTTLSLAEIAIDFCRRAKSDKV